MEYIWENQNQNRCWLKHTKITCKMGQIVFFFRILSCLSLTQKPKVKSPVSTTFKSPFEKT